MSDTPTLLSAERLAEIRKPYEKSLLDEASWHEISYRTISTNPEALSGAAKLIALDRQDLWQHIDAQRQFDAKREYAIQQAYAAREAAVAQALRGLLLPLNEPIVRDGVAWPLSDEDLAAKSHNDKILSAATSLGIDLT